MTFMSIGAVSIWTETNQASRMETTSIRVFRTLFDASFALFRLSVASLHHVQSFIKGHFLALLGLWV